MQTMYYTTSNFIRHTDNVVDLTEYRRRLARAAAPVQDEEDARSVGVTRRTAPFRLLSAESWASLSVVIMTLTFTVRILFS